MTNYHTRKATSNIKIYLVYWHLGNTFVFYLNYLNYFKNRMWNIVVNNKVKVYAHSSKDCCKKMTYVPSWQCFKDNFEKDLYQIRFILWKKKTLNKKCIKTHSIKWLEWKPPESPDIALKNWGKGAEGWWKKCWKPYSESLTIFYRRNTCNDKHRGLWNIPKFFKCPISALKTPKMKLHLTFTLMKLWQKSHLQITLKGD